MKLLEIERCSDCPYCVFYTRWKGMDDLFVCDKRKESIDSTNVWCAIDPNCNLEESINE